MSGQFCTLAMFFFYNNNHKSIETNTQPSRAINLLTLLHFCIFRCDSGSVHYVAIPLKTWKLDISKVLKSKCLAFVQL